MATIATHNETQLVETPHGYYYLADGLGTPISDGWRDKATAEASLMADDDTGWPDADLVLDDRGLPEGWPAEECEGFSRVQWDLECNPTDEFLAALEGVDLDEFGQRIVDLVAGEDCVIVEEAEARRFEAVVSTLPDWSSGPEFAPCPILFYHGSDIR